MVQQTIQLLEQAFLNEFYSTELLQFQEEIIEYFMSRLQEQVMKQKIILISQV